MFTHNNNYHLIRWMWMQMPENTIAIAILSYHCCCSLAVVVNHSCIPGPFPVSCVSCTSPACLNSSAPLFPQKWLHVHVG